MFYSIIVLICVVPWCVLRPTCSRLSHELTVAWFDLILYGSSRCLNFVHIFMAEAHTYILMDLILRYALVNNQAIRESIEDQMGILSLISGKSGVSLSMVEQRMLPGSPSSS